MRKKNEDQEVYIWPPEGSAGQQVYVNPPGGRPQQIHEARGTAHLVLLILLLIVGLGVVIVSCGVATALNTGAIW